MTGDPPAPARVLDQPRFFLASGAVAFLSFRALRIVDAGFQRDTAGHPTFDFQNRLTVQDMRAQLPAYGAASRRHYRRFFVADLIFPLSASLTIAALQRALLRGAARAGGRPLAHRRLAWNVPLLALAPTLFDWGENVCFLMVVHRWPRFAPEVARRGVIFKRLKLASLRLLSMSTALLALNWGAARLVAASRGTRRPVSPGAST